MQAFMGRATVKRKCARNAAVVRRSEEISGVSAALQNRRRDDPSAPLHDTELMVLGLAKHRTRGAMNPKQEREIVVRSLPVGVPLAPDRVPAVSRRGGVATLPGVRALPAAVTGVPAALTAGAAPVVASTEGHKLTRAFLVTGLALGFILSRLLE
jgi:hypothetical protein